MVVPPCGRGYVALSVVAAGLATLASPTMAYGRALQGLDLVEDLTAETIESMKADMSVNFMEAALLQATVSTTISDGGPGGVEARDGCPVPGVGDCSWPSYKLTDMDGVVHTCTVRDEPPEKRTSSRKKTSVKDVSTALDPLEGRCATATQEYWSYKWCHKGGVTQFHDNEDGTRTTVDLGQHAKTEVKRTTAAAPAKTAAVGALDSEKVGAGGGILSEAEAKGVGVEVETDESWISRVLKKTSKVGGGRKGKKSDPYDGISDFSELAAVFDFYEGGDECEEIGGHRHTRTSITCCATKLVEADGYASTPMAILVSIQEVSLCSYLVQVCSRLLCPALLDPEVQEVKLGRPVEDGQASWGGVALANAAPAVGGVLGLLEELEACFPPKRDTWWTYKLCFSTGISQYHEEIYLKPDGGHVSAVTAEYSLGKWDWSSVVGLGEDLIRQPEEEDGEPAIVLEFTGGTECDLTGVLRSSTVYLKCGNLQDVKEVVEDRTCHYRVVAISPLLCSHPALIPKIAPIRTVQCIAEGKKNKRKTTWM